MQDNQDNDWKGVEFTCKESNNEWLQKSIIGRVRLPEKITKVQEMMLVEGFKPVRTRYMGDNMFLLTSEGGMFVKEFMKESKEWLRNVFDSFEPWNPNVSLGNQLVWVRCTGVSLNAWNKEGLQKMMARFGTMILIADEIVTMENVQYARVLVRTSSINPVNSFMKIKINGLICDVRIVEEIMGGV